MALISHEIHSTCQYAAHDAPRRLFWKMLVLKLLTYGAMRYAALRDTASAYDSEIHGYDTTY